MSKNDDVIVKWEEIRGPLGGRNYVASGDGFYVSFNPDLGASVFAGFFDSDDGGPETALCKDGEFFILNGDYRDSYQALIPSGFEACKKFYDQQSAHSDSSWSSRK